MQDPRQIIVPGEHGGVEANVIQHSLNSVKTLAESVHAELRYIEGHTKGDREFQVAATVFLSALGGIVLRRLSEIKFPQSSSVQELYAKGAALLMNAAHRQDRAALKKHMDARGPGDSRPSNPEPESKN